MPTLSIIMPISPSHPRNRAILKINAHYTQVTKQPSETMQQTWHPSTCTWYFFLYNNDRMRAFHPLFSFAFIAYTFVTMTTAKSASYDYLIKLLLIGDSGKEVDYTASKSIWEDSHVMLVQVLVKVAYCCASRTTLSRRPLLQPLALISRFVRLSWMERESSFRFGIRLDRSDSAPLPQASLLTLWLS